ncbi:prostatic acid phosphatase-like [Bradysia coprophila]|uniref:prostatic acid phosphatase-like n=1 Tax=Bradysia coprophila TaxID=38358 RepID=UPI00187DC744|nr:prostatic acid phosphatase-like [Bradysia coprophila]
MAYCLPYCVFIFAIFIMSICVWLGIENSPDLDLGENKRNSEADGELVFVHVLYRHGDRNPVMSTPGSKYTDLSYWPEGWGQLTTLGIQQEYSLGQWLRRRYNNFLSEVYHANDIYVRSSDVDRTIMSAQSVLAGLYPPHGKQMWKKNFFWQPIPVHTVPASMDYLIATNVPNCSSYENAMKQYLASDEMEKYYHSIQPIFDYLTLHIGKNISTYGELTVTRDTWICETTHKYKLPQWVGKLYPNNDDFERAAMTYYTLSSGTKFLSKFSIGFFLKDILDRFTSKIQNTLTPNRKMWMYSSHDLTAFSFLRSLKLLENQYVPYAAAITLELRKIGNEHIVQIFYKNSDKNPGPIDIPGCGTACPLSKMYEIYDDIIPKNDFDTECLIPEEADTRTDT